MAAKVTRISGEEVHVVAVLVVRARQGHRVPARADGETATRILTELRGLTS